MEPSALDQVIRACYRPGGAEGQAAIVLNEAYGRGLLGMDEDRWEHEQYVSRRQPYIGPAEQAALKGLLRLRSYAYGLGCHDAAMLGVGSGPPA